MMSSQAPDIEPLAYKFVGDHYTWLCAEFDENPDTIIGLFPIFAPIEDEV